MAFVIKDRVKETTTSTGTGTIALLGAVTDYQSFDGIGDGNTTWYVIVNQDTGQWEVGIGTFTLAGRTLARTTVLSSSNADALVTFSGGTKQVFGDMPASALATILTGLGEVNTGLNVGDAGTGLFIDKVGLNLNFRKVVAGANITLATLAGGEIQVSAAGASGRWPGGIKFVTAFPYDIVVGDKGSLLIFDSPDAQDINAPSSGWSPTEFVDLLCVGAGDLTLLIPDDQFVNRIDADFILLAADTIQTLVFAQNVAPKWAMEFVQTVELTENTYLSVDEADDPQIRTDLRGIGGALFVGEDGTYPIYPSLPFRVVYQSVYLKTNPGGTCDVQFASSSEVLDGFDPAVSVDDVGATTTIGAPEQPTGERLDIIISNAAALEYLEFGFVMVRQGNE